MKRKGPLPFSEFAAVRARAFTLVETIVVVATVFVLAAVALPGLAKSRRQTHSVIDLANVQQILNATHLYAVEHSDYLPHPTWGTSITGWLFARNIPSATLSSGATPTQIANAISNQLTYFRQGHLAPYLGNDERRLDCPTDVAMRAKGAYTLWYLERQIKLTSYAFTGAVSGYGAPKTPSRGTFKLSDFRPGSFLLWEPDETRPFNFNDGAQNQENPVEAIASERHYYTPRRGGGPAMLGTFGLNAKYINSRQFPLLRASAAENDLRCGPGYR